MDIYEAFAETATAYPDRPFVWYDDLVSTYADVRDRVDRRDEFLRAEGIGPGDRVGLLLPNDPEFVDLFLAVAKRGATLVPFNYRQEGAGLEYLLTDADLSALIVDTDVYATYAGTRDAVDVPVFTHDVADPAADEFDLDARIADAPTSDGDRPEVDPLDVAVVQYTSGTTGPPKGVRNPHSALLRGGELLAETCRTDETDRGLLVLPLFHANPLTYGVMQMLSVGGSVALVREFSASGFWQTARRSGASYFTHVGSILEILWRTTRGEDALDTSNDLEFGFGGAARFDHKREFESEFGVQLVGLYGMTEIGAGMVSLCAYDPDAGHAPAHQGTTEGLPFEVRILSDDGLGWNAPGETGEILVRTEEPGLMFRGYLGKPEETVEDWQDLWFRTGDLGRIDDDGTVHYEGRVTTNIRRFGENISPWEIESVVNGWDAVEEAVAVGVPDEVAGEEVMLCVVPGDDSLTEAELLERCRAELADYLVPRYVAFVDGIPRTSTQKIERVALRDREAERAWDART